MLIKQKQQFQLFLINIPIKLKFKIIFLFYFVLFYIFYFATFSEGQNEDPFIYNTKKKLKEQEIIQKVLRDYDWRVRPRGKNESWPDTGGPVNVTVNIYLRSISKIDDVNMEYSAQFTFREEWWDPRLAYSRFADDETEVPLFVVLATSEQADLTQQIWVNLN